MIECKRRTVSYSIESGSFMQPLPSIHQKMNKNTVLVKLGWKLYLTVNVLFPQNKRAHFICTYNERERGRETEYRLSITDVIC